MATQPSYFGVKSPMQPQASRGVRVGAFHFLPQPSRSCVDQNGKYFICRLSDTQTASQPPVHKPAYELLATLFADSMARNTNVGGLILTRRRIQMHMVTLEINFALWGMIVCAAMNAAQFF
jgi:hypothetical protein